MLLLLAPFTVISFFMAVASQAGLPGWKFVLGFVLPHGIFEIPAILLSGALILPLGARFAAPNTGGSIFEDLVRSLADWAKIMLAVIIPLLLLASLVEALLTPQIAVKLLSL